MRNRTNGTYDDVAQAGFDAKVYGSTTAAAEGADDEHAWEMAGFGFALFHCLGHVFD